MGGPETEYKAAAAFFQSDYCPEEEATKQKNGKEDLLALDLSCGTGFVGRRMAASEYFGHVFCLDYSTLMLNECISTIQREREQDLPLSIVRGDAGCLPFRDAVLDAIHWGAALHRVPDAQQALREVHQVLKSGGKLYATTFFCDPFLTWSFDSLQ